MFLLQSRCVWQESLYLKEKKNPIIYWEIKLEQTLRWPCVKNTHKIGENLKEDIEALFCPHTWISLCLSPQMSHFNIYMHMLYKNTKKD